MLESHQGKKATYVVFVLIMRFMQFGAKKCSFFKVVRNHLKKKFKKANFFRLPPGYHPPDPDPQKNADPTHCFPG